MYKMLVGTSTKQNALLMSAKHLFALLGVVLLTAKFSVNVLGTVSRPSFFVIYIEIQIYIYICTHACTAEVKILYKSEVYV